MQMSPSMIDQGGIPECKLSVRELLLHALVIELEAAERYKQLAEIMEQIGNRKVAQIFTKMSDIETRHADIIDEHIRGRRLPVITPSQYHWRGPEAPENTDSARLFHLMTPEQALSLALDNEKHAYEFFLDVVDDSTDERVRDMAAEFAAEEEEHVAWVEQWLAEEMAQTALKQ